VPFCDKALKTLIIKGQETPTVQGWMPLGHGIRGVRPIPTIVHECQSAESVTLLTVFQPLRDDEDDRVARVSYTSGKAIITYASGRIIETVLPPN
jgi:hypothetical protein